MRPRNEIEYEQRRQQIIDGALEAFADKGFEKATNRDIARAAGIGSPGLIYHYFQDKADLFRSVIEERSHILRLLAQFETFMALPPREGLTQFGHAFLTVLDEPASAALLKLMLGEAARQPEVAGLINQVGPGRVFPFIRRYMAQQMAAGHLHQADPGAAARCFVGPLMIYILSREVFRQADADTLHRETMVETAVDIFLHGLEPV
ncbi:MAG: TetR/AcrR family transcriptional regulator [Chloroflexaceae bacterium]|nr:TetR/AcrR family transcriptional regulator [Chloroflexaceae bacterium]